MEGLGFEIFLDSGRTAFAAKAGLLDAAERGDLHRHAAGIETNHAELQRLAHAPRTVQVLGEEIGGQSEWRGIGDGDRFGLIVKPEQRRHRPECFLAGEAHGGGGAFQHHRRNIAATFRQGFSRGNIFGSECQGIGDMGANLGDGGIVDHRPDIGASRGARADLHGVDPRRQPFGEGIINAVLHQQTVGADAGLAAIAEFRGDRRLDSDIEIGIVEHDKRGVATQFQAEAF